MPNKYDSSGMIHQWIYVIIPVGIENRPYFTAFCKACRTYFSEGVSYTMDGDRELSPSTLPKYGCALPDDIPVPPDINLPTPEEVLP